MASSSICRPLLYIAAFILSLGCATECTSAQDCPLMFETVQLPDGCTINGNTTFSRFFCDPSSCTTCSLEIQQSTCCCRPFKQVKFQAECSNAIAFSVQNTTRCDCSCCDDIQTALQITVISVKGDTPVTTAQIFRVDSMELLGVTQSNGQFLFQEPLTADSVTIKVRALGFVTRTQSISLKPGNELVTAVVHLIPLEVHEVGLGGSAVNLHLGKAIISAPAAGFHKLNTNEVYEDQIIFRGVSLDMQDSNNLAALPATTFEYANENGKMEQFRSLLVAFMTFEDTEGAPLMAEGLRMDISLPDEDGTLLDRDIFLVVFNETSNTWKRTSTFQHVEISGIQKRQQSRVLEDEGIPINIFATVAMTVNADCWIQARTFDMAGAPFPGTFITLDQIGSIAGNEFFYRFGTDTGSAQNLVAGLAPNAVCLPLACSNFTVASVVARTSFMPSTSPKLIPIRFPPDTFTSLENAPFNIGNFFSIESVIIRSAPLPFYGSLSDCVSNGRETNANVRDFFSFARNAIVTTSSDAPTPVSPTSSPPPTTTSTTDSTTESSPTTGITTTLPPSPAESPLDPALWGAIAGALVVVFLVILITTMVLVICRKWAASRPNLKDIPVSPCVAYQLAEYPATNDSRNEEHNYEEIQSSNLPPHNGNTLASESPTYERLDHRKRTASRPNLQDVPVSPCVAYQLAEYPATNDSRIEEHNYKEIQSSNLPPYTGNRLASETPPYERLDRFPSSAGVHAPKIQNTNLKC